MTRSLSAVLEGTGDLLAGDQKFQKVQYRIAVYHDGSCEGVLTADLGGLPATRTQSGILHRRQAKLRINQIILNTQEARVTCEVPLSD
jgi:hypothetical protein